MSVEKDNAPGPLSASLSPPLHYIMINIPHFTPELIGGDTITRLKLTVLPYCWHICEKDNHEWAIIVTIEHSQGGGVSWHAIVAQVDAANSDHHPPVGGYSPTTHGWVVLESFLNEVLDQFLRPGVRP